MNGSSLLHHLSLITDFRQSGKINHLLSDILFLTVAAVIAGAEGWEEIEDFGHLRKEWLQGYGDFTNGIPSHDTIARVMSLINPKEFQKSFIQWMNECYVTTQGAVVCVDGKTLRRSYDKNRRTGAIHMVSAFSAANNVVLGQLKTEEKSNEIKAIPELLKLLDIHGCLVTIDAMGCQKDIAKTLIDRHADYLFAVKDNQKRLKTALEEHFPMVSLVHYSGDHFSTQEKSHGREETRLHAVSKVPDSFVDFEMDWAKLKTLGVVVSFRTVDGKEPEEPSIRYYISSAELSAQQLANAVRQHWAIENKLHWILDVAMREDECRIRRGNAAETLAGVRHIALNLLKSNKTVKAGIKRKQKRAAMSSDYLDDVLTGAVAS